VLDFENIEVCKKGCWQICFLPGTFVFNFNMMKGFAQSDYQIHCVLNFEDLVNTPFNGEFNANCWSRNLVGDFLEIVNNIKSNANIVAIEPRELCELKLSEQGQFAREIILNDWALLQAHGASPTLNLIKCYERDDANSVFSTDVYSFHVDSSPIATDTFLCTYYGEPSEILPNFMAQQKVLIPEIRDELKKIYGGDDEGFESFLTENFFDLHYQAMPGANPISLGIGNLWRLAVYHPQSQTTPCIHRAPNEKPGQPRLLMIC
jgi:hypothetical protein